MWNSGSNEDAFGVPAREPSDPLRPVPLGISTEKVQLLSVLVAEEEAFRRGARFFRAPLIIETAAGH